MAVEPETRVILSSPGKGSHLPFTYYVHSKFGDNFSNGLNIISTKFLLLKENEIRCSFLNE